MVLKHKKKKKKLQCLLILEQWRFYKSIAQSVVGVLQFRKARALPRFLPRPLVSHDTYRTVFIPKRRIIISHAKYIDSLVRKPTICSFLCPLITRRGWLNKGRCTEQDIHYTVTGRALLYRTRTPDSKSYLQKPDVSK